MLHFIRLTRPLNLFIVALTMYSFGWYLETLFSNSSSYGVCSLDFFLLVFSTVLIAAGGNIINDYFDVRADRINKPKKMIIGVYIKRRVAIVSHWVLNFIAFSIALYLSWVYQSFWYLFIHLLSINVLWVYSSNFKRKLLIGNILVAMLTGLVPLLVGYYFFHHPSLELQSDGNGIDIPIAVGASKGFIIYISVLIAAFAFAMNFSREIVKDIEDVEGDKKLRARTLPIKIGEKRAKFVAAFNLLLTLIAEITFIVSLPPVLNNLLPLIVAGLFTFSALVLSLSTKYFKFTNGAIKLAMIAGTLAPLWWKFLQ